MDFEEKCLELGVNVEEILSGESVWERGVFLKDFLFVEW